MQSLTRSFRCSISCLMLLFALSLSGVLEARESAAVAVVERLHDALLGVMQADDLEFAERRARLAPVIADVYDAEAILRMSLGRRWRELGEREREDLLDLQGELILSTYARRFDGYSGQRFVTEGTAEAPRDSVVVRSRIAQPNGDDVRLDYVLIDRGEGFRIFNVVANGFSEIATRRAEYSAIYARGGAEALAVELRRLLAMHARETR